MSPPVQRQVRFDIPMDTNEESQYNGESRSPTSNAAVGNTDFSILFWLGAPLPPPLPPPPPRFNFGMDIPMLAVESASPTIQQPLNVGFQLPIQAKTPPPSSTHQPFNLGFQLPPPSTPAQAALPAGPVQQPFNLGFQLTASSTPPQAELPAGPVNKPLNLGFQLTPSPTSLQAELPASPVNKLFNLGFQLTPFPHPCPKQNYLLAQSNSHLTLASNSPSPSTTHRRQQTLLRHLTWGSISPSRRPRHQRKNLLPWCRQYKPQSGMWAMPPTTDMTFQFNCEPLSPIGDWNPVLIRAPSPIYADGPSATMQPAPVCTAFGNAEQAAIDIVRHLQGEEFDQVAAMMVGGSLGVGESIRDPKPDEVLDSNRILMSAFCKNRDRLTRIFKDMISLHHMAQVQDWVAPMVTALLAEVERAEELISDSDE
ncbi:uncharacterized protein EDB91DRAFT_1256726 [Suillus paluster]|uniref:uncharacterized protein n=1 Tax=Suillus paluster TaxID=48578 RepID=UPI001B87F05A|nr:uncharacterized protein EDB91DRAFT_1256726 [Suillus paluster]KAG1721018.1 hypothetical protein EDB91DRAFT_1256726 [Suillus paluster]